MSNTSSYIIPTHGAPDIKSQEWLELSGLRLGMHLGSDPGWTDMPAAEYWKSWALFWDEMTGKKEAEIQLLSANNKALQTQMRDLRLCLEHALACWTENNETLQQQVRNLDRHLNHSKTPFDSSEEPREGFDGYIANSREVDIFDDNVYPNTDDISLTADDVFPTTDNVFLTADDVFLTADDVSVAANVSTNIALSN